MVEFADWPWRLHSQAGLAVAATLVSARAGRGRPTAGLAVGLALAIVAAAARSPAWGLVALAALAACWSGRHALGRFVLAAVATLGAGVFYLHTAVLWDVDLGAPVAALAAAVIPQASRLGEYLVLGGIRVHQAHLSLLVAIPALAVVLVHRQLRGWWLAAYGALGLVLAAAAKVVSAVLWTALGQPSWALAPATTGVYIAATGALAAFLIPSQPPSPAPASR